MAGAPKGNNNAGKNKPGVAPLQITLTFTQEETEIFRKLYMTDYKEWPSDNKVLGKHVRKYAKFAIEQWARGGVDWEWLEPDECEKD